MHQYNALAMFKFNDTAAFVQHIFVAEDYAYACQEACKMDSNHLERERKAAIIAYKEKQVVERRAKIVLKEQQKTQAKARLAGLVQVEEIEHVTIDMTVAQLKDQLEIYRTLVDGIPLKSHLKTKAAMVDALKVAIGKYKAHNRMDATGS